MNVNPLVKDFFERDLDELEERRLEESLLSDPQAAEALLAEARRRYESYGLPDPLVAARRRPARSAAGRMGWALAAAAGLLVGIVSVLLLSSTQRHEAVQPPAAVVAWKASALASGARGLGFAQSLPAGRETAMQVELAQSELVVVRVTDLAGKTLRILWAGTLPAGRRMEGERIHARILSQIGNAVKSFACAGASFPASSRCQSLNFTQKCVKHLLSPHAFPHNCNDS